jgi:hypothetical protein
MFSFVVASVPICDIALAVVHLYTKVGDASDPCLAKPHFVLVRGEHEIANMIENIAGPRQAICAVFVVRIHRRNEDVAICQRRALVVVHLHMGRIVRRCLV